MRIYEEDPPGLYRPRRSGRGVYEDISDACRGKPGIWHRVDDVAAPAGGVAQAIRQNRLTGFNDGKWSARSSGGSTVFVRFDGDTDDPVNEGTADA